MYIGRSSSVCAITFLLVQFLFCSATFAANPGMPSQEELRQKIRPQMPAYLELVNVEMTDVKTQGNAMMTMISANLLVHAKLKEGLYRAEGMQDGKIRLLVTHSVGEMITTKASLIAMQPGGMLAQAQGQTRVTLLPASGTEGQPLSFYQPNSYVIVNSPVAGVGAGKPDSVVAATTASATSTTGAAPPASKVKGPSTIVATPEAITRLLALYKKQGEIWGRTISAQRHLLGNNPVVLRKIQHKSPSSISGVAEYPYYGQTYPFTAQASVGQVVLREEARKGQAAAHTYIMALQGDALVMRGLFEIPLTQEGSRKLQNDINRHIKPWQTEKDIPALLLYGNQLWNVNTKQLVDDAWISGLVQPVVDIPGRYWQVNDRGSRHPIAGAIGYSKTAEPSGRLPLAPFDEQSANTWLSRNMHTYVQLKSGDLWRGEVDWLAGTRGALKNVTNIGLLGQAEPIMWYGNDFYLWRKDATSKPIIKINIQTGAIKEQAATKAFQGKTVSSNGRFKIFSDGIDGYLHVYDAKSGEEFTLEATRYQRQYGNVQTERPQPVRIEPVYWVNGDTFYCDIGWYDLEKRSRIVLVNLPVIKAEVPAQVFAKNYTKIPGGRYIDISYSGYETDQNGATIAEKRVYRRYRIDRLGKEVIPLPLELQNPEALKNHRSTITEYRATWVDENRYVFSRNQGGLNDVGTWMYDVRSKKHTRVSRFFSNGVGGDNPLFAPGQDFHDMEPLSEISEYLVMPEVNKIGFTVQRAEKIEYHVVSLDSGDDMVIDDARAKNFTGVKITRLVSTPIKLLPH